MSYGTVTRQLQKQPCLGYNTQANPLFSSVGGDLSGRKLYPCFPSAIYTRLIRLPCWDSSCILCGYVRGGEWCVGGSSHVRHRDGAEGVPAIHGLSFRRSSSLIKREVVEVSKVYTLEKI
jgi:hypothetical protein